MATFPGAIFAPSTKVDGVDFYLASHMNDVQNEIIAAQTAIGQEGNSSLCEGRLTLTTGLPITTADVTASTTLYFTPFHGTRLALHDGTGWVTKIFTELSIAIPNTVDTIYDAFVYLSSGTPTLEVVAWASGVARATALTTLDGVYVKSGATDRRYLGSFRTTGSSGNSADSVLLRYLWNYYNRVARQMSKADATGHTYNVAAWRQWNGDAAVQCAFIVGLREDAYHFDTSSYGTGSASAGVVAGMGVNTTTAPTNGHIRGSVSATIGAGVGMAFLPALGFNYVASLEFGNATNAVTYTQTNIYGLVMG